MKENYFRATCSHSFSFSFGTTCLTLLHASHAERESQVVRDTKKGRLNAMSDDYMRIILKFKVLKTVLKLENLNNACSHKCNMKLNDE
jgi:hypothetical protein